MAEQHAVVFLIDVDNTLLDNDRVPADLSEYLEETFGLECKDRYWTIFEELRAALGYSDYLGALQRYRIENPRDPHLLRVSSFLIEYPFAARGRGPAVIMSDGDVVFQPRKIERAGLWKAVDGEVLIYVHKELMLDDVEARYPARHYVMIDDKIRILAAMKAQWGDRLTTVFPVQGSYALDRETVAGYPAADVTIAKIGDLLEMDLRQLA